MSDKSALGDRMKKYEKAYVNFLPERMPVIVRVDGKAFHSYTKPLKKKGVPFNEDLQNVMNVVAIKLCEEIQGAKIAYVQSDEISLLVHGYETFNTQSWFQNKIPKMISISAAIASSTFTLNSMNIWKDFYKPAYFDSRVFVLPESDVCNYFYWRQQDCIRNSVQTLARAYFSHKQCNNKNGKKLKEMCEKIGFPWELQPHAFKMGRCVTKETYIKNKTERTRWVVDNNIPKFTEDRNYINKLLETNED